MKFGVTLAILFSFCSLYSMEQANNTPIKVEDSEVLPPLVAAAKERKNDELKRLLKEGAHVNEQDSNGYTALAWASSNGDTDIVKFLLEKGANVHLTNKIKTGITGTTPLMRAASYGHVEIANLLIKAGAKIDDQRSDTRTALSIAIYKKQKEMVRFLISVGAKLDQEFTSRGVSGMTYLMIAIDGGNKEIVELLLMAGVDVNAQDSQGYTAMDRAPSGPETSYRKGLVQLLLKYGVRVDDFALGAAECGGNPKDIRRVLTQNNNFTIDRLGEASSLLTRSVIDCFDIGETERKALLIEDNRKEFVILCETLRCNGVKDYLKDPEEAFFKWTSLDKAKRYTREPGYRLTLLMWASLFGHTEIVRSMLLCTMPKWYINAQDTLGRTALMYALIFGDTETALSLIPFCGSGVNLMDKKGKTALYYAICDGELEVINKLLAAGARLSPDKRAIARAMKIAAENGDKEIVLRLIGLYSKKFIERNKDDIMPFFN